MDKPVADVVSTSSSVLPWIESLRDCLKDLDVVSGALDSRSQQRLRENVRLLDAQLTSATNKLNQALQGLAAPCDGRPLVRSAGSGSAETSAEHPSDRAGLRS